MPAASRFLVFAVSGLLPTLPLGWLPLSATAGARPVGSEQVQPVGNQSTAKPPVAMAPVAALQTAVTNSADLVPAATEAAIVGLKQQVDRLPLGKNPDGSTALVSQYLDATGGHAFMTTALAKAQLIGGPRMVDEGTLQVRLDVSGAIIADALAQIASVHPKVTNFPPRVVAEQSRSWSDQTFTATGTATTGAAGTNGRTNGSSKAGSVGTAAAGAGADPALPPTANVTSTPAAPAPVPATPEAIAAARQSAGAGLLGAIATVTLPGGRSGKDLVALPALREKLSAMVTNATLLGTSNKPGGDLEIRLGLDREEALDAIRSAALSAPPGSFPGADTNWDAYRMALLPAVPAEVLGLARPAPSSGSSPNGSPVTGTSTTTTGPSNLLAGGSASSPLPAHAAQANPLALNSGATAAPLSGTSAATGGQAQQPATASFPLDGPPTWYFDSLDAEGTADSQGSKLLTARAAETQAVKALKKQLEALALTPSLTVGTAISRDARLADALSRALDRARVYRVEYLEDGSASVRVTTDPRYLWQDLAALSAK